jgi:hypothetical protein
MNAIETLSVSVGTWAACSALNVHRSRDYPIDNPSVCTHDLHRR